jgi:hypothetical protein
MCDSLVGSLLVIVFFVGWQSVDARTRQDALEDVERS